jgi:2-desacetyl-2-hydroxyethyl bacteriochlorophyllide A dehydrogenase
MTRHDALALKKTMMAVETTGNGGYDKLVYREVPIPVPDAGEVLIRVLAAGVNNTEINTRIGWYSSSVTTDTSATAQKQDATAEQKTDGGWSKETPFPLIQGTDCCGEVVQAADEAGYALIGKRVLVRPCMRPNGFEDMENVWMASDFNGAFAQYVKVPASEVFAVNCDWSNEELATIPCAYGTAENMLDRANVTSGNLVLIAGASGGVGSAAVQLAKRRGAHVAAITSAGKTDDLRELGADIIVDRRADLVRELGEMSTDVVVDNVAGDGFPKMLKVLKRGGRFVSSGAIAGPIVSLDMRDMYLKDLTLIGSTAWGEQVFPNLISYIERGEIRPLLANVFPLEQIAEAQQAFLKKAHVGKFVLVPPTPESAPA